MSIMTRAGLFTIISAFLVASNANAGNSSSASADAKAKVKKSIKIVKASDLDFGEGFSGDSALVLDPAQGAGFDVTGEKNKAYNITLPTSVTMTTGDGIGADKQIIVDNFTSNPSGSGSLDNTGAQGLKVGATRAALPESQESGDYAVPFTVTVVYQ